MKRAHYGYYHTPLYAMAVFVLLLVNGFMGTMKLEARVSLLAVNGKRLIITKICTK